MVRGILLFISFSILGVYTASATQSVDFTTPSALLPKGHVGMDSPTAKYILSQQNTHFLSPFQSSSESQKEALRRATHEVIEKENMISKAGRFSLIRGEKKEFYINQKCFGILTGTDHLPFVNTRFNTDFSKNSEQIRKEKLKNGCAGDDLFTGYSLFSGGSPHTNPVEFYMNDKCCTMQQTDVTPEKLFNRFNHGNIYRRFSTRIDALDNEYKNICPNQQLLLLSLSPDAVAKTVYPAHPGGKKYKYQGSQSTAQLLTTLKSNPQFLRSRAAMTFCHITTPDYGLHPHRVGKDIKIYTITGADPDKMKAYLAKEKALFSKVKEAIKKK